MTRRDGPRSFDPRRVGALECAAWVAYYRRNWTALLRASVGLVRRTTGLAWPAALYGAGLVAQANRHWAAGEPDRARGAMRRFYALPRRALDPERAAELEVDWWRVHREGVSETALVDALAALYSYVYDAPVAEVTRAAELRALAMRFSDRWVSEGRDPASPLVGEIRAALVRSYAALLSAVHRPA